VFVLRLHPNPNFTTLAADGSRTVTVIVLDGRQTRRTNIGWLRKLTKLQLPRKQTSWQREGRG
jgi:hypothetical protein